MSTWQAQIFDVTDKSWKSVRPTGEDPYSFECAADASRLLRTFYPDTFREQRLNDKLTRLRVLNTETGETLKASRNIE